MCDRTKGSDPANPQFWHDCVPNEEHRKTKNSSTLKKMVYEQKK